MPEYTDKLDGYEAENGHPEWAWGPDFDLDEIRDEEYERLERLRYELAANPDNDPTGFSHLRNKAYIQIYRDLSVRLAERPVPTQDELAAGVFDEELEPQVRDAVLSLRAKGYNTSSSGFDGNTAAGRNRWQHLSINAMSGPLAVEVVQGLAAIGVFATRGAEDVYGATASLRFKAGELDLGAIKNKWDQAAKLLPDTGTPAGEQTSLLAQNFRLGWGEQHPLHNPEPETAEGYLRRWIEIYSVGNPELAAKLIN